MRGFFWGDNVFCLDLASSHNPWHHFVVQQIVAIFVSR